MKHNRLDGVLVRNRKQLVLDLALAAFFLMALFFSGLAFGAELPKLQVEARVPLEPAAEPQAVNPYADPYGEAYAHPADLALVDGALAAR